VARRTAWGLLLGMAVAGCSAADLMPAIDPPCRGRADATDCQSALETALPELGQIDGFEISVDPITCDAEGCATWVNAIPPPGECLPLGAVELTRHRGDDWEVASLSHGDPPCAFE
jgi:hypothetical protein